MTKMRVKKGTQRPTSAVKAAQRAAGKKAKAYNPYMAALVDPEHYPAVGVPDRFSKKVHLSKIVTERNPVFINNKSAGAIMPNIRKHVGATTDVTPTVVDAPWENTGENLLRQPGRDKDWYSDHEAGSWDHRYSRKTRLVTTADGSSFRFFGHLTQRDGDSVEPVSLETVKLGSSKTHGLRCSPGDLFTIRGDVSDQTGTSGASNITCYAGFILNDGSLSYVDSAQAGDFASISLSVTAPANTKYVVEYGMKPSASSTVRFERVSFVITISAQHHSQFSFSTVGDVDEYNLLTSLGTEHRVSAMSLWLQYFGALTSNGRVAVAHIQDRSDPSSNGLYDFSSLAKIPGAYVGPLHKGAYCFWKPTELEDEAFEMTHESKHSKGHLAFAFESNDTNAQDVVIRTCVHVETVTENQVVNPLPSMIQPEWVVEAQRELRLFPSAMENDTHVAKLAQKIGGGLQFAGKLSSALTPFAALIPGVGPELAAAMGAGGMAVQGLGQTVGKASKLLI